MKNGEKIVGQRAWERTSKAKRRTAVKTQWGGEEVSLFSDSIESQCDYRQDEESDLERNKPATSTANTIANEAGISLKIVRFIKNQNMFAK